MPTVLIVESDPLRAALRKSTIEQRFLDVVRVSDASDALCLVEQPNFANRLGLVVASHPMLGIGIPAFLAELHARLPQVPILVILDQNAPSLGDLAPGQNADPLTAASIRFLPRPFSTRQLLDLASEMLPQPKLKTA